MLLLTEKINLFCGGITPAAEQLQGASFPDGPGAEHCALKHAKDIRTLKNARHAARLKVFFRYQRVVSKHRSLHSLKQSAARLRPFLQANNHICARTCCPKFSLPVAPPSAPPTRPSTQNSPIAARCVATAYMELAPAPPELQLTCWSLRPLSAATAPSTTRWIYAANKPSSLGAAFTAVTRFPARLAAARCAQPAYQTVRLELQPKY